MSKKIKKMYRKAGLKPPKGKGIHTLKFHKCVVSCKVGQRKKHRKKVTSCYAVCMASIGRKKAVRKAHRRRNV